MESVGTVRIQTVYGTWRTTIPKKGVKALGYDTKDNKDGRFVAAWFVDKDEGVLVVRIIDTGGGKA